MKTPDNYRFLVVATYRDNRRVSVLFATDREEALEVANCEALNLYKEEIEEGYMRIDTYKVY